MPKMTLSDEEARHIHQRRDNEKRFASGYNQALIDINAWIEDEETAGSKIHVSAERLRDCLNRLRKVIR